MVAVAKCKCDWRALFDPLHRLQQNGCKWSCHRRYGRKVSRSHFSCSPALLRATRELAEREDWRIHTHASENLAEVEAVRRSTGRGNVDGPIGASLGTWFVTLATTNDMAGTSICGQQLYIADYFVDRTNGLKGD